MDMETRRTAHVWGTKRTQTLRVLVEKFGEFIGGDELFLAAAEHQLLRGVDATVLAEQVGQQTAVDLSEQPNVSRGKR